MTTNTSKMTTTTKRHFESLAEAAERTGISVDTLRRRIAEGRLPAYRSGPRLIRVDIQDVDSLMRPIPCANRRQSPSA